MTDHSGHPAGFNPRFFPALGVAALLFLIAIAASPPIRAEEARPGVNTLSVGTGSGASGTDVTVPLSLSNQDVVKGLQTDIEFDPAKLSYVSGDKTPRVGTMAYSASVVGGNKVRVVMYYVDANTLAAGTGAIANLTFHLVGAGPSTAGLTPGTTTMSDPEAHPLTVTNQAGSIQITGNGTHENTLSVGTGSGASGTDVTVPLSLSNQDVVKGLQTDIEFDPAKLSYVSGDKTPRVGTMAYSASVVGGNKVRVVMYYVDANTLAAGTGAIANLTFHLVGAGPSTAGLTPGTTTMSDPEAHPLTVTNQAGSIQITGNGTHENTLSVGTGSGASGTDVTVPLSLSNQDVVKGLQTDIEFDPAKLSYVSGDKTPRVGTMAYSASVVGGNKVRVVMYYVDANTLAAGTGAIANLTFHLVGAGPSTAGLTPGTTTMSDPDAHPLTVTNQAGSIQITGNGTHENTLSVGTGSGASGTDVTVPLSLSNQDVVKGLQTDIEFDPAKLSYVSGDKTPRVGTMAYSASVVGGNKVRVVMYYVDANTLAAGTGAIANLTFHLVGAGPSTAGLTPGTTTMSDPEAHPLTVTNQAGSIQITGNGTHENTLSVGTGSGASGTDVTVPLSLSNQDVVKGLQTDIEFDPAKLSYVSGDKTPRVGTMAYSASVVGGNKVRVVMYYVDANTLAAGTGAIANLTFHLVGAGPSTAGLTPGTTTMSDPDAHPLTVTNQAGSIQITGNGTHENTLSVGTGSGASGTDVTVPLSLSNQDVVKGLQTDIEFDPAKLSYVSGDKTPRVGTMAYSASVVGGNKVRVVMYYVDANTLAAGTGAIANLTFHLAGAGPATAALTPGTTTMSDPEAHPLTVTNQAGSIQITGGGPQPPQVTVNSPNGGESWQAGSSHPITWTATDPDTPAANLTIALEYSTNAGTSWISIATAQPNTGTYAWALPGVATTQARVRVTANDGALNGADASNGNFTITAVPAPVLYLFALKNPGRTRTLQVFVSADQALAAAPAVTVGGAQIEMNLLDEVMHIYQGAAFVADGQSSVVITATGSNGTSQGTTQTTVTF